jgi:hypothetical protein
MLRNKSIYRLVFALIIAQLCYHIADCQVVNIDSSKYLPLITFTQQEDHENMMKQLGIKQLRPGPSGNETAPNHANYDESLANPCPQLPDILTTDHGKKVTSQEMWWKTRRPELVEVIEREIYGRLPVRLPKVTWLVKITDREFVALPDHSASPAADDHR